MLPKCVSMHGRMQEAVEEKTQDGRFGARHAHLCFFNSCMLLVELSSFLG
jgi:hypothetical protein